VICGEKNERITTVSGMREEEWEESKELFM
jgi:hypothetical protein